MTNKSIEEQLKKKGFKLTRQRRAIVDVIGSSQEPLTPSDIYEKLRGRQSGIGRVTVYRTLEVLQQNGMLCELHIGDTCRSYLKRPGGHHHHLVCHDCGRVVDFTDCELNTLEYRLGRKTGFKIDRHLLEFMGLCKSCQENGRG
jgi:Fur family transcriptional regulator, ferric uptake regulator